MNIWIDIATSIDLIESGTYDPSVTLLNLLNVFFDILDRMDILLPSIYKDALWGFADHLTFFREIDTYFQETGIERSLVRDGILWMVGVLFGHAYFLPEDEDGA